MKHLIISALFLLALIIPATALAHDFEVNGIYYNINGNEISVTYAGVDPGTYTNAYSGEVIIPESITYNGSIYPVTSISDGAFLNCTNLISVIIPNSIISIGYGAFDGCINLSSIEIPKSVKSIASIAFMFCTSLTSIEIPNSVTSISNDAFSNCKNLTSIVVANDNQCYDSRDNCNAIIETTSNTLITGCQTTIIPNSVTTIGDYAFYGCTNLTSIDIPNSITTIGEWAFAGCSSFTTINIPNSVTTIGKFAIYDCSNLTTAYIGNSVTTIGECAFTYCPNLANISVANDNPKYDSRNNCNAIIETATNTLIAGCKNTAIPTTVTAIGNNAFYGCSNLTDINIPNSVTAISTYAFYDCSNLTSATIPNSVTAIGNLAFCNCSSLTTINIGNSVTSIGNGAFLRCSSLSNVYCYATTPPECFHGYYYSFSDYSATLHVPAASLAAYFTTPGWNKFENIIGDAIEPTGISISRDSVEILSGEQIELTATVIPANASCKEVTWYSTDTSIATVNNGVVTAVGIGDCDIYAYCMGMPAICHVSVTNRISLEQQEAMLLPNHMLVLNPTAPAMPAGFTVTSSDPTVAAARVMNGKVQIVGIKEGTTTITVSSTDGTAQPATCLVTVYTELGDANCDGFLNISDLTLLIDYLMNNETTEIKEANADLNGDGNINIADVTALIDHLLTTTD